jgi:hypothetical protein
MHVIFFVQAAPNPVGNGSNHRAYQVAHDLRTVAGEDQVTIFDYNAEMRALAAQPVERVARRQLSQLAPAWSGWLRRFRRELHNGRSMAREWLRQFTLVTGGPRGQGPPGANRTLDRYNDARVFARYFERVRTLPRPLVCVVRHSNFARLAWANRQLGISTIACPANLEAFDVGVTRLDGSARTLYLTALNFSDELRMLAACDARLFISRVETGLVNGLGMPAHYYPYRPVGAIRQTMLAIRQLRATVAPQPGLFVMLGSANHPTTGAAFRWFLQNATAYGLPAGARVIVCGRTTEGLAATQAHPAIELRGWVDQDELNGLLAAAQGVLLPQHTGFGGLTRLAELSCAHIPGIVSTHATHAVQPMPPGFVTAEETWSAWQEGMRQLMQTRSAPDAMASLYAAWEAGQGHPWAQVLRADALTEHHQRQADTP